jgi:hypothetical protein
MTFTFACPACEQPLRAPKAAVARWGQCPSCSIAFRIPEPADEIADNPSFVLAEAPELVSSADGWTTVRTALLVYRAGLIVAALGILGSTLALGMTLAIGETDPFLRLINVASGLIVFAGLFMLLAGQFLCCSAPRESRARGIAIASVICCTLAVGGAMLFGLSLLGEDLPNRGHMREPGPFGFRISHAVFSLTGICAILGVLGHAGFAGFVKTTAVFFRNEPLARATGTYIWVFGVLGAGALLSCFALLILASDTGPISPITRRVLPGMAAVCAISGLALFLWFLNLTGQARRTISRALKSLT